MTLIIVEKLKKSYEWWEGNDRQITRDEAKHYFDAMIDAQATIEAEPIKHGRWIKENKVYPELPNDGDYYWYCSECKSQDQHNINVEVPFCWHCGARMDKSEA